MKPLIGVGVLVVLSLVSLFFFSTTGIGLETLYNAGFMLNLPWQWILLSVVLFSLGLGTFFALTRHEENKTRVLFLAGGLGFVFVMGFFLFRTLNYFAFSLCLVLSLAIATYFDKPKGSFGVGSKPLKKGLFVFTILGALVIFFIVSADPLHYEHSVKQGILSTMESAGDLAQSVATGFVSNIGQMSEEDIASYLEKVIPRMSADEYLESAVTGYKSLSVAEKKAAKNRIETELGMELDTFIETQREEAVKQAALVMKEKLSSPETKEALEEQLTGLTSKVEDPGFQELVLSSVENNSLFKTLMDYLPIITSFLFAMIMGTVSLVLTFCTGFVSWIVIKLEDTVWAEKI